ncbi:MAG: TolC family protein [Ignavibacteriales bacterium]|nr:TolC family protein [Ignavibacteriales bacterium]
MKKLIILNMFLAIGLFAQAQKFTLKESIELGLKNSKDLKISRSKVVSTDAKITETTSQLLPQLKFQAGYSRLSDIPPFEVKVPFSPTPIRLSDVILNNYTMKLSLQQPLFTGFRLTSIRSAAKLNNQATELELIKDINEAAFKIQTAFWNYYKAQQQIDYINENLVQTEKHLQDTKNFLENELVTKNDMLKLEVQYSNTKLMQIDGQNNLDIARMVFNQALGIPLETPTEIDIKDINSEQANYKLDDLFQEAKENRNELKAMQYRLEASENGITAANSGWFPSIYLSGNFYYNRPNQRILPTQDKFKDTWDVGVALNWDLWNWGFTSSQTAQAEQTKIQTETSLAQLNEAVEIEVYQNYLTYQRAAEKISVSRTSLEQAKENYRSIKEKYNAQLATSTDLIDAEASVLLAETNNNTALVDYQLAKSRLEKSVGRKIY